MLGIGSLRTISGEPSKSKRGDARRCEAPGCLKATREAKPFCSEHVHLHAYAAKVEKELQAREALEQLAAEGLKVSETDSLAEDILSHLRHRGKLSPERIARELNMDVRAVKKYVSTLARTRRVKRTASPRRVFVEASGEHEALADKRASA